jgi:transcriptional regulator with XRE-family HTH domain
MTTFATRLTRAREAANLTRADLADAVGVSRSAVAAWESGRLIRGERVFPVPSVSVVDELCGVLGVTRDDLLGEL